ncbi:MAG: hypothetical protein A3F67_05000 [Verrucomicrobia bacterium RIFCSPHIGHO2_12_FULL_41_10]|nr:MAG: hypothetical protein A3F67_05000 [Verrucomicrobia bacterium RIFCSPHIGHO2_12_FULL_41_10]HLB34635.1 hypothetical protein [Chthoniobacterales bacterium]
MFEPGEKVVCINDQFEALHRRLYRQLPTKGDIYTVRECSLGRTKTGGSDPGISYRILLEEISNDLDPYMDDAIAEELGFRSDRFAPLIGNEETAEMSLALETIL